MPLTPSITFRGIDPSAALDADIRKRIAKLEALCPRMVGCRVLVEFADRHRESGNRFHVRIELAVPGEDIVVTHDANHHASARDLEAEKLTKMGEPEPERKDVYTAVHDAFGTARRLLQTYVERLQPRERRGERGTGTDTEPAPV